MKTISRILITGARSPVALEWVRQLARTGYQVFAADTSRLTITRFSRLIAGYDCYTAPRTDSKFFENDLRHICAKRKIDLIIPTCEEVFWLPESPISNSVVFYPGRAIARRLHDKVYVTELCHELNIQVPQTWCNTDVPSENSQWILKPRFSRSGIHAQRINGTLKARNIPEGLIAQPFIHGTELCFTGAARDGVLLAAVCYKPIIRSRQNAGGIAGPAVAFEACTHLKLTDVGARIIKHTGYTGMIGIDAIIPPEGPPVILDINPRTTSGIHLFGSQLDVVSLLNGQHCCNSIADGTTAWIPLAARLSGNTPANRDVKQWNNVIANRNDPLPALGQVATLWQLFRTAQKHSVSLLAASTADIEWNGEL